jgi:hypothetical protein
VTVKAGCQPGPTSPPGLPGAPAPVPGPAPAPTTTTQPVPTSTARPPPAPSTTVAGPTTTSVPVTTQPPAPPAQVRITAPAAGSTVSGVALVSVSADGLGGIRRVDLSVDGVREQADYHGPFLFAWTAFTLPAGSHTLRATVVRSDGTTVRSAPVTVETTGH